MTNGPAQGPRPTSSIPRRILLSFGFLSWSSDDFFFYFFNFLDGESIDCDAIESFISQASRFTGAFTEEGEILAANLCAVNDFNLLY